MDKFIFRSPIGDIISSQMFGAKLGRENGPLDPNRYTAAFEYLGVEAVRFSYDAQLGEYTTENKNISTSDALSYTAQHAIPVTLCLDTKGLLLSDVDNNLFTPRGINYDLVNNVKLFLRSVLSKDYWEKSSDDAPVINAIEIGNEYWGLGGMTSKEYGSLVNVLAASVQEVIDDLGTKAASSPIVLVQMGSPYAIEFQNRIESSPYFGISWYDALAQANFDIISQIRDIGARDAIGGLVEHYYYTQPNDKFTFDSESLRFIDQDWKIWADSGFSDRDLYITEWNNKLNNPNQFGLKGAGVVLEMFENMVKLGVDGANIWPFQHNDTRLVDTLELAESGLPRITPRGAVFKLMAEVLPGMKLMESNISTATGFDYELNAYTDGDEYAIFIASRVGKTLKIDLDVSNFTGSSAAVEGVKIGYDLSTADGFYSDGPFRHSVPGYQDPDALATITPLGFVGFANNLEIDLGAFEILRLTFSLPRDLPQVGTERADALKGSAGNDTIYGNGGGDVISGSLGFDHLNGGSGRDYINSGQGNDLVIGGSGGDRVVGGIGYDTVRSGFGADTIYGGSGNDTLDGGRGSDSIFGGNGLDSIYGGQGDDRLDGGAGCDHLTGGAGRDVFIFDNLSDMGRYNSADKIIDFRHGYDTIDLSELLDESAHYIGGARFGRVEGEVRYVRESGILSGDMDGDGRAEWQIHIINEAQLTSSDLLL